MISKYRLNVINSIIVHIKDEYVGLKRISIKEFSGGLYSGGAYIRDFTVVNLNYLM